MILRAAASYALTARVTRPGLSRARFEAWQARRLARWLTRDLPRAPFYAKAPDRLTDLPVTDKAILMADFVAFNSRGVTAEAAWDAIEDDSRIGDLTVGASTGTSGNKGLYVIDEAERADWLGAILAKALPDIWRRAERVAILLPTHTRLYDAANGAGRTRLRFFDLKAGPGAWENDLVRFAPTTLVAPPSVLMHLAGRMAPPRRCFSAGEVLDPADRPAIEDWLGGTLGQIYMATEGLLGVTCPHGTLHLAEDATLFELEPAGEGLVSPLVTGFRRHVQIMARYRMNDLLRLSEAPCPCGSPLLAVEEVVGRMDDALRIGGVLLTPDILRNAVIGADRRISDFRLEQTGPETLRLSLEAHAPEDAKREAAGALEGLLAGRGISASVEVREGWPAEAPGEKRRRVRRALP
ncbi:CoF synthetase [Tropicimonas sp. IMCC34011]|uniref:CoF synthetase n=1 Tax=Tropicimonas sp. IMCC34011 TaxID=2248759 RepID=UPI000E241719|nr:CoF synthetase [Tropicimonas sp. IMCC34011]